MAESWLSRKVVSRLRRHGFEHRLIRGEEKRRKRSWAISCLKIVTSAWQAPVSPHLPVTLELMPATRESAIDRPATLRTFEFAILVALAMFLMWKGVVPGWRTLNTDFPNYYIVARLLREGYPLDRIYDWIWLQRIRDHWGIGGEGVIGFAGLTPFSAWPVLPLTFFSALKAKRIWIVLNLAFLAASAELLHRSTNLNRRRVWIITLFAYIPLRTSFLFGQMHILVLLLLVLAYFFLQRRRPIASGACIALAGALKVYPLLFLLYFAWKKQYRVALAILVSACVLIAAGLLSFGPHLLHLYAMQIVPSTLQAEAVDPYNIHAASAASLLHHLFLYEPSLNPRPVFVSINVYAILYPLFQLAIFLPLFMLLRPSSAAAREKLEWAAFLLALLVVSPFPASYHFVVMVPCMALLVDALDPQRYRRTLIAALILYVLISPASRNVSPRFSGALFVLLSTARLWVGLVLLGLFLFCLARQRPSPRSSPLRVAVLCTVSIAVMLGSMAHWRMHLTSVNQQMARRLTPPQPVLLATDVASQRGGGYMYTGMASHSYRIFNQDGDPVYLESGAARDQLSFALVPSRSSTPSGDLFIELADATGSNIVLVSHGFPPHVLLHDAESPALSADGHTVAFLRERKGIGSIWTAEFDGISASQPVQAIPDGYQVRTVAFLPSGELLFTASRPDSRGHLALYTATPGDTPHQLSAPGEDIGSAAISSRTRFIGITRLVQNHWQLAYLDPVSGRETWLTQQDCNAYAPAWATANTLLYSTDCARGYGLTALAAARAW
jgi:hypothetical protein